MILGDRLKFNTLHVGFGLLFIVPLWLGFIIIVELLFHLTLSQVKTAASIEFWVAVFLSVILSRFLAKKIAKRYNFLPDYMKSKEKSK